MLARTLAEISPSILVSRVGLDLAAARAWRAAVPSGCLIVVCETLDQSDAMALTVNGVEVRTITPQADPDQFAIAALHLAERTWTELATRERSTPAICPQSVGRVALVGAGIVNLITALELARDGHEVIVFEAAPDPRLALDPGLYGCTSGGGNARMFTLTEADNYNDSRFGPSETLPVLLNKPASRGGWRLTQHQPSAAEARWMSECGDLAPWLSDNYTEDVLAFNREAGELWAVLRRDEPEIFDGVALRDGIVRLYDDAEYFHAQVERQRAVGALQRVLDLDSLVECHPALAEASKASIVGAIEVRGFTLAIHDFVARLLTSLEDRGVRVRFNERVSRLHWRDGKAGGVVTDTDLVSADHYVISPGVYGDRILRDTSSDGQIHGVLGVWLAMPNIEPRLEHSLKVSRRGHVTEDSNITVAHDSDGRPVMILGAGYGWVGLDRSAVDPLELEVLFAAVEDTACKLFPHAYAAAATDGTLVASRRVCVRPWTSSSLGIFETLPAHGGGAVIVTGGHNTGGFAQAPAVARAVCCALRAQHHPMHTLYHPDRRRSFLGQQSHAGD
jgi:D-amino-acid dehydrogenase